MVCGHFPDLFPRPTAQKLTETGEVSWNAFDLKLNKGACHRRGHMAIHAPVSFLAGVDRPR